MQMTRRMILSLMQITGASEDALTKAVLSGSTAFSIIGHAKRGDLASVRKELEQNSIPHNTADLAQRVATKHRNAVEKGESRPWSGGAELPEPGLELPEFDSVEVEDAPGLPADALERIKGAAAEIIGVSDVLADRLRQRVQGALDIVAGAVADIAKERENGGTRLPLPGDTGPGYIRPNWFDEAASIVQAGCDLLLVGPAGTGKTRAGAEIAQALGMPYTMHDIRADMRRSDLLYKTDLVAGETVVTLAPLLEEVQTACVSVLNEPFSLDPEKLLGFNGLLESGQRSISTPLGVITRHPEHRFVLASNTSGRSESRLYKGPQAQDASTLSRVVLYRVDVDPRVELALAKALGLGDTEAAWVCGQVQNLRQAASRAQLALDVTPRLVQQYARLRGTGIAKARAAFLVLLMPLEQSERGKVSGALDQTIVNAGTI